MWLEISAGLLIVGITGIVSALGMKKKTGLGFTGPKPPWQPPGIVFEIVWPILYVLEGIVLGLLIEEREWALAAFFIAQTVLCSSWTWLFFRWKHIKWALAVLATPLLMSVSLEVCFIYYYYTWEAILFLPYILWCMNAMTLNGWYIWGDEPLYGDYENGDI